MAVFADRLKELRKNAKLKQSDIASLLNISTRNYQEYEYGNVKPSHDIIIAVADYFSVSTDYLLGRADDPSRH